MISAEMRSIVNCLENDWDFIESFLNNPEETLRPFKISDGERQALMTRDFDGLLSLGFKESQVVTALSGAHSQGCSTSGGGGNR